MTEKQAIQKTINEKIVPLINDVMDTKIGKLPNTINLSSHECPFCEEYDDCKECPLLKYYGRRCFNSRWFAVLCCAVSFYENFTCSQKDLDLAIAHLLGIKMELEALLEVADGN